MKAVVEGRTLAEWAQEIAHEIAKRFDPHQIFLFGSVARGDDDLDSDIDLLLVTDASDARERAREAARSILDPYVDLDVHVVPPEQLGKRWHLVGSIEEAAVSEGVVLHGAAPERGETMADPEAQHEEAARWLRRAEDDLRGAETLLTAADLTWMSCFHAQQAVEKALKAALVHDAVRLPRTHEVDGLAALSPARWGLREMASELTPLNVFAVSVRYPGIDPGREATEAAIELARRVVTAVRDEMAGA